MVEVPLYRHGKIVAFAEVDDADIHLAEYHWTYEKSGYAIRSVGAGRTLRLHREVAGLKAGDHRHVDHIDRNKLNNSRSNLRVVSRFANMQNVGLRRDNTSGFRGVSRTKTGWMAYVKHRGRLVYLGTYSTAEGAAMAAESKRSELGFSSSITGVKK